jgi:predicted nuclease of predicted toxin-antitoxin system
MARFAARSHVRVGGVKIVIDMNLGKDWIACLEAEGHIAVHWSSVGRPGDDDSEIMQWASINEHAVMTADLDFGKLLASTNAAWPSVIQLRTPNTPPSYSGRLVLEALRQASYEIEVGSLVTIEADRFRVRPLPIKSAF